MEGNEDQGDGTTEEDGAQFRDDPVDTLVGTTPSEPEDGNDQHRTTEHGTVETGLWGRVTTPFLDEEDHLSLLEVGNDGADSAANAYTDESQPSETRSDATDLREDDGEDFEECVNETVYDGEVYCDEDQDWFLDQHDEWSEESSP